MQCKSMGKGRARQETSADRSLPFRGFDMAQIIPYLTPGARPFHAEQSLPPHARIQKNIEAKNRNLVTK